MTNPRPFQHCFSTSTATLNFVCSADHFDTSVSKFPPTRSRILGRHQRKIVYVPPQILIFLLLTPTTGLNNSFQYSVVRCPRTPAKTKHSCQNLGNSDLFCQIFIPPVRLLHHPLKWTALMAVCLLLECAYSFIEDKYLSGIYSFKCRLYMSPSRDWWSILCSTSGHLKISRFWHALQKTANQFLNWHSHSCL